MKLDLEEKDIAIREKDSRITELKSSSEKKDSRITSLEAQVTELQQQLRNSIN